MKKITKNVNATYCMDTGFWKFTDNGETIAEGQGVNAYCEAYRKIKATTTKKIKENMKY